MTIGEEDEARRLLADSIERLLGEHCDPLAWRRSEDEVFPAGLWSALEGGGFLDLLTAEDHGGAGAAAADALIVFRALGRHCAPGPAGETLLLRGLVSAAGIDPPKGVLTVPLGAEETAGPQPRLAFAWCPWGRAADWLIAPTAGGEAFANICHIDKTLTERSANIAGEPRDLVRLGEGSGAARLTAGARFTAEEAPLLLAAAFLRASLMAGALETVLTLTVRYAQERVQFGRPIGQFQAIQHQLAQLATEAAAALQASTAAAMAIDREGRAGEGGLAGAMQRAAFEIAAAKSRVGEAAGRAAGIAHQVHGAIGFTEEHRLHRSTRRLWSWRAEAGSEAFWNERIGAGVMARGADALWADLTARG